MVELLAVLAVMAILAAGAGPAMQAIQSSEGLSMDTANISTILDLARAYAMANNTYVFVGFYESDGSQPSNKWPAPAGVGRLWMSVVASNDGTRLYDASNFSPANLTTINKLVHFDNVHLTATAPANISNLDPSAAQLAGSNSIISFGAPVNSPGTIAQFAEFIQFDPRGVVSLPTTVSPPLASWVQINLVPAHGNQVSNSANAAVLQIDGITGSVRIFRP